MSDINIYVHNIPERDLTDDQTTQSPETSLAGLLTGDSNVAERISTPPGDLQIRAQHRGLYGDLMAAEVSEFAESSGFSPLPVYVPGTKSPADGFYVVSNTDVGPSDPRERRIQDVDVTISRSGTRADSYRAVRSDGGLRQVTHPFGNDDTAELGIPVTASDVYWVAPETDVATAANQTATRTGERGDIAIYDATNAPVSNPILVYDAGYGASEADVWTWDTRGHTARDDANGYIQWQRVAVSTHDYGGDNRAISTGLLRLRLDPKQDPGIIAEEWDDSAGSWNTVSLGTSSWQLDAIDIGHRDSHTLSPARVDALTRWTDGSSTYSLDMTLHRGQAVAQFDRSQTSDSPVPSGLQDLLDPIASASLRHPQQTQTLRPRSEVEI